VTEHFTKGKKYVKSNPDVGHWFRNDIDVVKGLKMLKGTIASIHFKDVGEDRKDCVFGEGIMPVKEMLRELDSQKYDGWFVIEYENEWKDNIPSIKKCVEFLRKN
jgi:sugar phosphate isomerase/epimerase